MNIKPTQNLSFKSVYIAIGNKSEQNDFMKECFKHSNKITWLPVSRDSTEFIKDKKVKKAVKNVSPIKTISIVLTGDDLEKFRAGKIGYRHTTSLAKKVKDVLFLPLKEENPLKEIIQE